MMSRVQKGMVAGFVATVAVSVLEAVNLLLGPWFTPFPSIVAHMIGMEGNLAVGWVAHFLMGAVVLGALFGILCPRLPTDTSATKGIAFAVAAFVALLVGILLFGDATIFNASEGFATVAWLLITNVVFGVIMGVVYGRLVEREKKAARAMADGTIPAH